MKKFSTIVILFSGVLLFVNSILALPQMDQPRGRAAFRPDAGRLLSVLNAKQDDLEITDEQLDRIEELTIEMEDSAVEIRNELAKIRLELRRQLRDREESDYDQLKSLITQSANLRADRLINWMKYRDEVNNVLTEEQITALKDMFKKVVAGRRFLNRRDDLRNSPEPRRPIRK